MRTVTRMALMAGLFSLLQSLLARAEVVKPSASSLAVAGASFDFAAWDALLKKYDDGEGRVDYKRLAATPSDLEALDKLYAEVARQKLDTLGPKAREAFLIDAYNVCVWKGVLARLPDVKSVGDSSLRQLGFFVTTKYVVAGTEVNLKSLESDWIRKVFQDARVHVALNCASGGCPLLPTEAFTPDRLDTQLDREARRFVMEERNVRVDLAAGTVMLSKIFDWYGDDFGGHPIAWINKFRPADKQIPEHLKVKFMDWDWRLNDRHNDLIVAALNGSRYLSAMDWKLLATTFSAVFLAELGDKTQLATLGFASEGHSKVTVFVGSAAALVTTSLIAVLAGGIISKYVSPVMLQRAAGVLFIVLGAWTLWKTV